MYENETKRKRPQAVYAKSCLILFHLLDIPLPFQHACGWIMISMCLDAWLKDAAQLRQTGSRSPNPLACCVRRMRCDSLSTSLLKSKLLKSSTPNVLLYPSILTVAYPEGCWNPASTSQGLEPCKTSNKGSGASALGGSHTYLGHRTVGACEFVCVRVYVYICVYMHPSIFPSIYLSTYLSIYLATYLPTYLSI